MKHVSLLIALMVLFGVGLHAQTTTTVEKNTKRISITSTKLDDHGQPVTETWIAEGQQPEVILKSMAINPEILEKVDVEDVSSHQEGERLFLFRKAGDQHMVEGILQDVSDEEGNVKHADHDVIIWSEGEGKGAKEYTVAKWYEGNDVNHWNYAFARGGDSKINCAALGIYASTSNDRSGCLISSLIDQGGAEEAGLTSGDVITRIDDYPVSNFPTLFEALAHYLPGDDATVSYLRDGQTAKVNVHLKSWADLPGHEWRARGDCGKVEQIKEDDVEPQLLDDPNGLVAVEKLELQDARMYPNPTSGVFAFSFTAKPGPLTVTVTDVNGKVVYTEENENATGQYNRDINLKDVPTGNYVVSVKQGDRIFSQQLSKQ